MGVLSLIVVTVGGIVGAVLLGLLKDEVAAWLPRLNVWIIRLAVLQLPQDGRERMQREWEADLWEWPGKVSQFARALAILQASHRLSREARSSSTKPNRLVKYHRFATVTWGVQFMVSVQTLLFDRASLSPNLLFGYGCLAVMSLLCVIKSVRYLNAAAKLEEDGAA